MMRFAREVSFIALASVMFLFGSGCGKEEQRRQDEVVREFERTFAVDAAETTAASRDPASSPTGGTATRTDRRTGGSTASSTGAAADSTGQTPREEVPPVIREAAQEVVQYINTRQYPSAVQRLDGLMNEPTLTADQWIAARNAMVELQRQIVRDPSISDEEREQIRRLLDRGR